VIVIEVEAVHWFASVIVNECVPAGRVNGPVPLYGDVPPDGERVTVELPPLHGIGVEEAETTRRVGSVIEIDVEAVQLFASVTV